MGLFSNKLDFIISPDGIDIIEKIIIGGIEQFILIQADDKTKPVLLFLHGGPSMPLPGVSSRGMDYTIATNIKELIKNYILVFWDQRGTGKSYNKYIPKHTMNVPQFVNDTIELTDYLRNKFKREKVFLVAHSWGSIIGLKAVSQQPQKYYSYVGISQIVDWTENDKLGLIWTKEEAKRRGNDKALKELNSVGEPPLIDSFEQWGVLRKWQRNFGTLIYSNEYVKHPGLFKITMRMLYSKDYSIKDMFNTFYKGFKLVYTHDFIKELPEFNFLKTTTKVKIPITFIHGTHDMHVHGELVKEYYEILDADKGKNLIWLKKSAHIFHPDDTKIIENYLIDEHKHLKETN